MSLGVLNNLSAMSAANNLNNTQNSLAKTLQQMSSGSRINSGADDAAGLSLVNGLQANATALAQSQTNATEGVGLLQVADGALSQVTNLLNRAVTLATEVSNGTLNGSQQSAANQEYQSILSEINNIGSTTTYNQKAVFNTQTNIYVGDSSTSGASMDSLKISTLSSANLGDTAGAISYSNGQGNVFINLSKADGTANAQVTDSLSGGGATSSTVTLEYVSQEANGPIARSQTITVGGTSGYANTAQGLMNAINNSGMGLTASWGTAQQAGSGAVGSALNGGAANAITAQGETGIIISGSKIAAGGAPSGVVTSGVMASNSGATTGFAATNDTFTGNLTINGHVITTSGTANLTQIDSIDATSQSANNSLAGMATFITANSASLGGAKAAVVENADGTFGLSITQSDDTTGNTPVSALTVSGTFTDSQGGSRTNGGTLNYFSNAAYNIGITASSLQAANQGAAAKAMTDRDGSGIATISYTASAGQSLSGTDLSSQSNAQSALTSLNSAIANVAAQDGYIGAQINTLTAVSSVISTQQQNITAAQNAVQATDYAAASSAMSKFQILSQTGIAALAQANSTAQLVTKLLQ